MKVRLTAVILALLSALLAFSALADGESPAGNDPFPELEQLRPNVEFWTRAFSEWSLGQVAIHDLEHPGIVYEIVELPGPAGDRYTEAQQRWVDRMRESWEDYLQRLELKVSTGETLAEIDKQWALYFANVVGSDKLQGAHERVRTQRGLRERFRAGLERSFRFDATLREILREEGLPEDLAYLPHVESSFQYQARSTAGAAGIWQFTRGTGKQFLTINSAIDERLDPIVATHGAAAYLRAALEKLETWPMALTSYNHGVQGMERAKKRFGTDFEKIYREYDGRSFGFASKNFYAEFLAARRVASDPDRYFPEGYAPEPAFDHDLVVLDRRLMPRSIASHYGLTVDELAEINPGWLRKATEGSLRLPAGTRVWLPAGTLERPGEQGTPAGPLPAADGEEIYVVRGGDTLSTIADAHGIGLTRLREMNGLSTESSLIRIGQRLYVGSEATRTAPSTHTVRRGETLSFLSEYYGITVAALREANGLSSRSSLIHAGQTLRLPAGAAADPQRRHVVRRGETLGRIASRYGIGLSDLLAANTLTMRSVIYPGQTLLIPH